MAFNVAFVQIQLATFLEGLDEAARTARQLQEAADGLESAIKALGEIAGSKNPPYPKDDLEQRASMARTRRNQLDRGLEKQKEYEAKIQTFASSALEIPALRESVQNARFVSRIMPQFGKIMDWLTCSLES